MTAITDGLTNGQSFNKTSLSTDMQCCDELEVRMSGTAYFHQQDKVSPQNRDIFHLKMNTGRRIQKNAILFYIFFPVSFFELSEELSNYLII